MSSRAILNNKIGINNNNNNNINNNTISDILRTANDF